MKIILFADYYNEITGNPIQVYANSMEQKNHEVHVFSSDKYPTSAGYDDSNAKVIIHRFKGKRIGTKCFFPGAIIPLFKAVGEKDVLHAHVLGFFSVFIAGYLRMLKKFRLVVTADYDALGKKQNMLLRLFNYFFAVVPAKKADVLLAFTQSEKKALVERFGFEEKKIRLLPIGINWQDFRKKQDLELKKKMGFSGKFVLLSACYLSRKKNIEAIINAVKKTADERIVLVHAGGYSDREYAKELLELVKKLGLEKRVFFFGDKKLSEMPAIYSIANAFVNAGFNESYAIPILEAMASGLPVLTTRVGIASEAIKEGENGFFVESGNDIAEKTVFLMKNPAIAGKMREQNILRAKDFDWKKIIGELEKIYLETGIEKEH